MARRERIVFRVEKSQGCGLGFVLGGLAFAGAAALSITNAALFWGGVAVVTAIGYFIGHTYKNRRCSECKERLTRDAQLCLGCGGIVKRSVSNARELLAAEEALERDE